MLLSWNPSLRPDVPLKIDAGGYRSISRTQRSHEFVFIAHLPLSFPKSFLPTLFADLDTSKSLTTSEAAEFLQRGTIRWLEPHIATWTMTKFFWGHRSGCSWGDSPRPDIRGVDPLVDSDVHDNVADNDGIVRDDKPCPFRWIDTCDWLFVGTSGEPSWNKHDERRRTTAGPR